MAKTSKNTAYLVFVGLAIILLIMGILLSGFSSTQGHFGAPDFGRLVEGYKTILTHPSMIDFDGLKQAGQFGSAFFNSGMLLLVVLLIYKLTRTELQGVQIAAAMMVLGFSFYGKNILNIWFPIIGVLLHTKVHRQPLKSGTALAFFSTALSPVFSQLAFGMTDKFMESGVGLAPFTATAYVIAGILGILGGYLIGVLAGYLPSLHKGFVLFNAGFAAGLACFGISAFLKAAGLGHDAYRSFIYPPESYMLAEDGGNLPLVILLAICFVYLVICGFATGGGKEYGKLFWRRSKGGNFVEQFGVSASLINMGVMGFMATLFVFLTGKGQLSGPVFGCIWTAVGFAANGVTVRTYWPTMAGVYLGAFLIAGVGAAASGGSFVDAGTTYAASRGMLLAAIFSCGLAPIAGEYGPLAGFFVGLLHSVIVTNTGALHGFMSLYNNGLSLSLIATFCYPIYSRLGKPLSGAKQVT